MPKFLIGPLSHEEPRGVSYEDGIVGGEDGHVSNMQRGDALPEGFRQNVS